MREHKYRGKDIVTGEWWYGSLVVHPENTSIVTYRKVWIDIGFDYIPKHHKVDPETVVEFTGLRDKDGVEIYEGDATDFGIIVWNDGSFCVDCGNENQRTTCICQDRVHRFTVIGNIHDNPDMQLKGTDNEQRTESGRFRGRHGSHG